ncbi:DUF4350 domain-containing protein [Amphibacillus sp. Q70]|uniref:DUF4350 domain-containing protein n=1 Tax=Amphibacillus sp. Q70 TaxID=3453416 RepID=UPI003F87CF2D
MVSQWLKEKKVILLFLGLFTVLMIGSYYLTEQPLEDYPPYHVESPAPDGTKGFYQSLAQLDYPVEKFTEHPAQLTGDRQTALFLFNPPIGMEQEMIEGYQQFVQTGGTVFLLFDQPNDLFEVDLTSVPIMEQEGEILVGEETYTGLLTSAFRVEPTNDDEVLILDGYGPIAIRHLYGSGQVIQFSEPNWFTNQAILEADHLAMISEIIALETYDHLLFETYHGQVETGLSVLDVMPNPLIMFGVIGIVVSLLYVWMKGKRYGPARDLREQVVRFGDERIRALANWQIKGRNYHQSLQIQVNYLKQGIFERTGIPVTATWSEYQMTLEQLLKNRTDESIQTFINQLSELLASEQVNKQEFLEWTKRIDEIRREVEA